MEYAYNDKVYTGITRVVSRRVPSDILVIAWFDGEPELWQVRDAAGLGELRRLYTEEWGNREIPFDVYEPFKHVHV